MKLKYLLKLNALLIICSLILNSYQDKITIKSDATLAESIVTFIKNEPSLKENKENHIEGNHELGKIFIESNSVVKNEAPSIKYTLKKEANPLLKTDAKSLKRFNQFKQGTIKTGVADLVTSVNPAKRILSVKPLFLSLDRTSFNFFESANQHEDLYSTIRLEDIAKITHNFPGTFCLTVVNRFSNGSEQDKINFCLKSESERDDWLEAISQFKEHNIKVVESKEHVIFDFNKINILLREKKKIEEIKQQQIIASRRLLNAQKADPKGKTANPKEEEIILPIVTKPNIPNEETLKGLYYDNTFKANRKPNIIQAKETQIKKEVGKIIQSIKLGNVAQRKMENKFKCSIKRAEKIKKEVEKQKELIKNIIQRREQKEKERHLILSQKMNENKELILKKLKKPN
jgi:hypothetical protein